MEQAVEILIEAAGERRIGVLSQVPIFENRPKVPGDGSASSSPASCHASYSVVRAALAESDAGPGR